MSVERLLRNIRAVLKKRYTHTREFAFTPKIVLSSAGAKLSGHPGWLSISCELYIFIDKLQFDIELILMKIFFFSKLESEFLWYDRVDGSSQAELIIV